MVKLAISAIIFIASAKAGDFENPYVAPNLRIADLLSRMSPLEKISQMGSSAPALPNLGLKAYEYRNEALHGVVANAAHGISPSNRSFINMGHPLGIRSGQRHFRRSPCALQPIGQGPYLFLAYREHGARPAMGQDRKPTARTFISQKNSSRISSTGCKASTPSI